MEVSQGKDFPGPRFLGAGLPGQAWGLQSWYSAASPAQGRPPLRGSGLVHVLLRTRKPSSQSREQEDQGLQEAQPPLTVSGEVAPPRRRSSTRAEGRETGLSDKGFFKATLSPGHPAPATLLWAWEEVAGVMGGPGAVPSVSQVPEPSAGQVRVSVLLLPNCRP